MTNNEDDVVGRHSDRHSHTTSESIQLTSSVLTGGGTHLIGVDQSKLIEELKTNWNETQ